MSFFITRHGQWCPQFAQAAVSRLVFFIAAGLPFGISQR